MSIFTNQNILGGIGGGAAAGAPAGPAGALIGAGIGAASSLGAGLIGKHSNNQATDTAAKGAADALSYQKQKDAQDRADAQAVLAAQKAQWDAMQAQKAPYTALSQAIGAQTAARLGLPFNPNPSASPMPPGWAPGTGVTSSSPTLSSVAGANPYSSTQNSNPYSQVAGMNPYVPPQGVAGSPVQTPAMLSLSDVLNGGWTGRRA